MVTPASCPSDCDLRPSFGSLEAASGGLPLRPRSALPNGAGGDFSSGGGDDFSAEACERLLLEDCKVDFFLLSTDVLSSLDSLLLGLDVFPLLSISLSVVFSGSWDNALDLEGEEGVGGSGSLRTPGSLSESPRRMTTGTLEIRDHYMQNLTYSLFYQYTGCGKKNRRVNRSKGKEKCQPSRKFQSRETEPKKEEKAGRKKWKCKRDVYREKKTIMIKSNKCANDENTN